MHDKIFNEHDDDARRAPIGPGQPFGPMLGEQQFPEADFYTCYKCGYLITKLQLNAALQAHGELCPACRSNKVRMANLPLSGILLPRVWLFAAVRIWELGPKGLLANARKDAQLWAAKFRSR
jgi:hypothetical protein